MDCSQPGSSVHGIFQARILEWVAISYSDIRHKILEKIKFFEKFTEVIFCVCVCVCLRTSLVAQTVKRLSTKRETRVRSLGREDHWRRKWQSTPVLLPGKSQGQRSLVGYSPWGRKESDTAEWLHFHKTILFLLNCERQNFLAGRVSVYSSSIFLGLVTL